ncbi:hypothetical protein [Oceanobacillus halotolerans]|uniref:hypothetical protein n=1 Tax=Oceanobacillus halotolerans TaxID=2663380 RepID=UPI0013D9E339|nr:hypothetical protein [Oceanobacillus halotolerans]
MNIEVNFLEKEPNKYVAPIIITAVFVLLLAGVVALLFFQQSNYQQQIDTQSNRLSQLEMLIREHQAEHANEQQLREIQQSLQSIEAEMIPNVELYEHVLGLLDSANQLTDFDYSDPSQLVVEAQFDEINDVANYVSSLLEDPFIIDTQVTSVQQSENHYQAVLTISIDNEILIEEFSDNA